MTPQQQDRIAAFAADLNPALRVQYFSSAEDEDDTLAHFAERLESALPRLSLRQEALAPGQLPYLQIGDGLRCAWVPKDAKLDLFLKALAWAAGAQAPPAPAVPINPPDLPAEIRLYLADACPHCHQVLEMLLPLAFVDPMIRLTLIDAQVHVQQSAKDAVRSVPTTLLDSYGWSGVFPLEELVSLIQQRSPVSLGPTALEMMLSKGQAGELAALMQTEGKIFPAYYEIVTHPLWSVRLGALVVAETLAETAPQLANAMAGPLWERYPELEIAVKGDVVYLLGEIGAVALTPELRAAYQTETDPELRDALSETLEKLT